MKWLIDNWFIFVAVCVVILVLIKTIADFAEKDTERKITVLTEWLKYAVVEAEKALGSNTGQLKLRYVYDMAIKQFPWLSTIVPFAFFSGYVDDALDWMKDQLDKNKSIADYVKGAENGDNTTV